MQQPAFGGRQRQTETSFQVLERHAIASVGDAALPSENLTVSTPGASPAAIDSRAGAGGLVPDPELHQTTIAAAIAAHRPALVVFSTPVYCISRFCGPITDMVDELAKVYGDRASFIHVEIWRDFQQQTANKVATDWLYRNDTVTEPWVFLIDRHGEIAVVTPSAKVEEMHETMIEQAARLVVQSLREDMPDGIVIDLSQVNYFGSVFVSFLLRCHSLAKKSGSEIVLAGPSDPARELLLKHRR